MDRLHDLEVELKAQIFELASTVEVYFENECFRIEILRSYDPGRRDQVFQPSVWNRVEIPGSSEFEMPIDCTKSKGYPWCVWIRDPVASEETWFTTAESALSLALHDLHARIEAQGRK